MEAFVELVKVVASLPPEKFMPIISLSGIGLAAFAIYVSQKGRGQ